MTDTMASNINRSRGGKPERSLGPATLLVARPAGDPPPGGQQGSEI